jgi:C1A family cysteine protease
MYLRLALAEEALAERVAAAALDIAVDYQRLANTDIDSLKHCLAFDVDPIVFGCSVFQQFDDVGADGLVQMPDFEAPLGGHCMLIVGYDDAQGAFLVRNSWGEGWGMAGYCWMPYAYPTNPDLASDFWRIGLIGAAPSN